jgi:hypothetical protein
MPRAAVKLSQSRESPPPWWPDEFHRRQTRVRPRVIRSIQRAGGEVSESHLTSYMGTFSRAELMHAIDGMVRDGVLRRFRRTEPLSCAFGQATEKKITRTCYALTDAEPRERKGDA